MASLFLVFFEVVEAGRKGGFLTAWIGVQARLLGTQINYPALDLNPGCLL